MSKLDDAINEAVKPKLKRNIKDLMLELIDSCEEFESDLGSELLFDQNDLRKKVQEL